MNEAARPHPASPLVCPFVALAEDRNRRADAPDQANRCYAEPAPRQRDLAYQADYCYSHDFASCSVFLAWAARNAAEPAYVSEAAQRAWASGIAVPEDAGTVARTADSSDAATELGAAPTPERGLFGPPDGGESGAATSPSEQLDWVSASAWAEAPWDDRAEAEAEELALFEADGPQEVEADGFEEEADSDGSEEATTGPKVPAALPMRRRRTRQRPIRTRGSGEWFYADPPDHEPLVKRRYGVTPPILLGVLGLLVAALIVFMIPTLLSGGGRSETAAIPPGSPNASAGPVVTSVPVSATAEPSVAPSLTPKPASRTYTVKDGDSLSAIADKPRVNVEMRLLQ
ncbi:MAG: hypothetical protein ACC726_11215, partial [Chloroflexota bacterium]